MKFEYRKIKTGSSIICNKLQCKIFCNNLQDFVWVDVFSNYDDNAFEKNCKKFFGIESEHPFKIDVISSGIIKDNDVCCPCREIYSIGKGYLFEIKKYNEEHDQYLFYKLFGHFDFNCFKEAVRNYLHSKEYIQEVIK